MKIKKIKQKVKSVWIFFKFHRLPPLKVNGLYTRENVDIYGQPLTLNVQLQLYGSVCSMIRGIMVAIHICF